MNIRSTKIDELAERLAHLTGEDLETALSRAIEERLARIEPRMVTDRNVAIQLFVERASNLPVLDSRPADDIIGYGHDGLPA
jgi:antitoxin VapB